MQYGLAYVGTNSGTDTPTVLTLPAQEGYRSRWLITSIHAAYGATPQTGKVLSITDGVLANPCTVPCTAAGPAPMPWNIAYAPNQAVTITLPAGGSGVLGHLTVGARVVQG
jgi:hypothetical protein